MESIRYVINNGKELLDLIADLEKNADRMEADIKDSFLKLKDSLKPVNILKRTVHAIVNRLNNPHASGEAMFPNKNSIKELLSKPPVVRFIKLKSKGDLKR